MQDNVIRCLKPLDPINILVTISADLKLITENHRVDSKIIAKLGNNLENVPLYSGHSSNNSRFYTETCGLPEFVVRCIERIESMISTVGIYRINGDASLVEKIK